MLGSLGQPYREAAETRMTLLIPQAQKSHCCILGDQTGPERALGSGLLYFLDVKEANGTFRRYPLKRKQKRIKVWEKWSPAVSQAPEDRRA